jgi:hypothetical protein
MLHLAESQKKIFIDFNFGYWIRIEARHITAINTDPDPGELNHCDQWGSGSDASTGFCYRPMIQCRLKKLIQK